MANFWVSGISDQIEFLDKVDERVKEKHAKIMLTAVRAIMLIIDGDFEKANTCLKEVEPTLKAMYNLNKIVYSYFFKAKALYYLKRSEFSEFYQNSLQYLAYTSPEVSILPKTATNMSSKNNFTKENFCYFF